MQWIASSFLVLSAIAVAACHGQEVGAAPFPSDSTAADDGVVVDSAAPVDSSVDSSVDTHGDAPEVLADTNEETSADGSDGDAREGKCPTGRGPEMALLDAGDVSFCIDKTEVTVGDVNAFIVAGLPTAGGPSTCDYTGQIPQNEPASHENLPAYHNITWCWAEAVCRWSNKRLCRGLHGGLASPTDSEWQFACTNGGKNTYPYGDVYDATKCQTLEYDGSSFGWVGPLTPVSAKKGCHGIGAPYDSLFDMSGNVVEYVNDGPTVNTSLYGGWSGGGKSSAPCAAPWDTSITRTSENAGFRCCATPTP